MARHIAQALVCAAVCGSIDAFAPARPLHLGRVRALAAPLRMQARPGGAQESPAPVDRVRRALLLQAAAATLVQIPLESTALAADGKGELVLVAGATGGIGQYAVYDLLQRGYKVRGITRRDKDENFRKQIQGSFLSEVEWVHGDLNDKTSLAPAVKGAKKIIFCAGAHGWEDIENNRRIYFEAVQEMSRLGAQHVDRFVLISSAGLDRVKPEYSEYLKDVLAWKKKGELSLKASGVPYSIVRAYSLNNEAEDAGDEFTVAIFQGDPDGVAALITRKDLGEVAVEALLAESTKNSTFEVGNARKNFMGMEANWRKSLAGIAQDAPLSRDEVAAIRKSLSPGAGGERILTRQDAQKAGFFGDPSKGFRN